VRVAEELVRSDIDLRFAVVATTLEDTPRGKDLQSLLATRTTVHRIEERALRAAAATENPQGVLVVARAPQARLDDASLNSTSRVLVCDGVQDPGNLGTLIRVADAFAAAAVILLPGSVDAWNPKVVRSAAGSSFHLPIIAAEVSELSEWLRTHAFHTLGADIEGEPLEESNLVPPVALVVGNEGAGLRAETRPLLDRLVRIDTPGHAESLNVAVAAGILMYRITRGVL
jgi:TrmH family RNA methyltransferase